VDGICCRGNIFTPDPTALHLPLEEYFALVRVSECVRFLQCKSWHEPTCLPGWLGCLRNWSHWCPTVLLRYGLLWLWRKEAVKTGSAFLAGEDGSILYPYGLGISDFFAELRLLKGGKAHWSVFKMRSTSVYAQLCTSQRSLSAFLIDNFTISHYAISRFHDSLQGFFSLLQLLPVVHVLHVSP